MGTGSLLLCFTAEPRDPNGPIVVKGKGEMHTYLLGRGPPTADLDTSEGFADAVRQLRLSLGGAAARILP